MWQSNMMSKIDSFAPSLTWPFGFKSMPFQLHANNIPNYFATLFFHMKNKLLLISFIYLGWIQLWHTGQIHSIAFIINIKMFTQSVVICTTKWMMYKPSLNRSCVRNEILFWFSVELKMWRTSGRRVHGEENLLCSKGELLSMTLIASKSC